MPSACSRAGSTTCATRRRHPSPSSRPPSGPSTAPSSRRTRSGCSPRCWCRRTGASSTPDLEGRLRSFLAARELFPAELLALADVAIEHGELSAADADRYLELAAASFALSTDPVDRAWYAELERVSGVAADIGGVTTTHINHLTPRVLDIDDLYASMQARGIEMIDEIQGPPRWDGPDVLLRQTSFRALAEPRTFRDADGAISEGSLRVRFGEVEARGIALTPAGRDRFDELVAAVDRRLAEDPDLRRADVAPQVWSEGLPATERDLCLDGLGFFTFRVDAGVAAGRPTPEQSAALERGDVARARPGRRPAPRADRLRGLPAPFGCRHLRLEPDRQRNHGRGPGWSRA